MTLKASCLREEKEGACVSSVAVLEGPGWRGVVLELADRGWRECEWIETQCRPRGGSEPLQVYSTSNEYKTKGRERERERERGRQTETEKERERGRQTETEKERQTQRHRQTDRDTERHRQTDRQTDRNRQTETERQKENE